MLFIAKILGTICGKVVLICRRISSRLRAIVGVYEEAIEGEIAICIGRNAAREIICVLENEEYPDGDTCKVCESGKSRTLKENF
jgi:hypothetical protein